MLDFASLCLMKFVEILPRCGSLHGKWMGLTKSTQSTEVNEVNHTVGNHKISTHDLFKQIEMFFITKDN